MRSSSRWLLGAALLLAAGGARSSSATPLHLILPDYPDIVANFIDVTYDADTDRLAASGVSIKIALAAGVDRDITNGGFSIEIETDGTSAVGVGGNELVITGDIDLDGNGAIDGSEPSGLLLSGNIQQFGAAGGAPLFEFVFDLTGGALADLFAEGQAGVILGGYGGDAGGFYDGDFGHDFDNLLAGVAGTGAGNADTAPIPEPGTLLLLGAGVAGLLGYGRRRRRAIAGALVAAGLAAGGDAAATLLNQPLRLPLLSFDNGGLLEYDASSGTFTVEAAPIALRESPGSTPLFVTPDAQGIEQFDIALTLDAGGQLVAGTLLVHGAIDTDGDGSLNFEGDLLTGSALAFGSQDVGTTDLFDFAFEITGGLLAEFFVPQVGVALQSERSTFAGSFAGSFEGKAKGTLGVVPEPATIVLTGSGVAGLAFAGRKRAR
jgi:phage baseplate assembly protein gpV